MTERYTSNHNNSRAHEGALLENGVQLDVMGANGGRFERPPTRAELLRVDIGKAAANSFVMRQALLQGNAQLQVLEQEREFYPDPVAKKDIVQNNYDLAG